MSGRIQTKIISFRQEFLPEYEYLQQCANASRLVCELVRDYRLNNGSKLDYRLGGNEENNKQSEKKEYGLDVMSSVRGLLE